MSKIKVRVIDCHIAYYNNNKSSWEFLLLKRSKNTIYSEIWQGVTGKIENSELGIKANYGWFEPFEAGKPTVLFGIHGGAEWTGACIDAETGHLYVTSNELPWFPTVSRISKGY